MRKRALFKRADFGGLQQEHPKKERLERSAGGVEINEEERALFESILSREVDANGGATVLACSQRDVDEKLVLAGRSHEELVDKFSVYFLGCCYGEVPIEDGLDEG